MFTRPTDRPAAAAVSAGALSTPPSRARSNNIHIVIKLCLADSKRTLYTFLSQVAKKRLTSWQGLAICLSISQFFKGFSLSPLLLTIQQGEHAPSPAPRTQCNKAAQMNPKIATPCGGEMKNIYYNSPCTKPSILSPQSFIFIIIFISKIDK